MRAPLALALLLAGSALAQGRPTLVDAPLDVRVSMPEAQAVALQGDFRQALAQSSAVLLPTRSSWKAAVAALKRQDCDVRNDCLQQLALTANTLYALYASVERNAAGTEFTATGRIVNQDGRLARPTLSVVVPALAGHAAALDALKLLLTRLELEMLPVALAAEPLPTAVVQTPPLGAGFAPPPLPPPEPRFVGLEVPVIKSGPPPGRVAAWVLLGGAIAAAGVSAGFGASALVQLGGQPADGHFTTEAQARSQQVIDRSTTVSLGAGIGASALLVTSIILFAASSPVQVAATPTPDGATVVLTGKF